MEKNTLGMKKMSQNVQRVRTCLICHLSFPISETIPLQFEIFFAFKDCREKVSTLHHLTILSSHNQSCALLITLTIL